MKFHAILSLWFQLLLLSLSGAILKSGNVPDPFIRCLDTFNQCCGVGLPILFLAYSVECRYVLILFFLIPRNKDIMLISAPGMAGQSYSIRLITTEKGIL